MVEARTAELAAITATLDAGTGGAFAVIGDAGIGKSTFVAAVMDHARAIDVPVVTTRWSGDAASPPMWSWSLLVRNWIEQIGPAEWLAEIHPLVRRLVPDIAASLGMEVPDAPVDELTARFATGDGLGRLFARHREPALFVLEDLHHAPPGGLGFLESFATAALGAPVVVVATSRDRTSAAGLTAVPSTHRVELGPLARVDAERLVRELGDLPADVVEAVVSRADGNPFFLTELTRLAAADDSVASTTPGVREVVLHRVDGLGPDAREVLAVAALLGRKPDISLLCAAVGDRDGTERVLDAAERAQLVDVDGAVMRWNHDLVRDSLVESLGSLAARRIHARIAAVLANETFRDTLQLAHHLLASGDASPVAADAGERAALTAADLGAHEDAVGWVDRTLEIVDRLPEGASRGRRLELLAGRSLIAINEYGEARERLVRSAEQAIAANDGEAAATALLLIGAQRLRGAPEYEPPITLMRQALTMLDDRPATKTRMLGRYADLAPDRAVARQLTREAIAEARALGDPDLLITCLGRELLGWRDTAGPVRAAIIEEIETYATAANPEYQFEAMAFQVVVLMEAGDLDEASRLIPIVNAGALRLGLPQALAFHATVALIHLLQGRFEDSEETISTLISTTKAPHVFDLIGLQAGLNGFRSILRGEFADFMQTARFYLDQSAGTIGSFQVLPFVALGGALSGEADIAQESLDEAFRLGLHHLVDAYVFGQGVVFAMLLAEAACLLNSRDQAAELERFLLPYAGRMPVGGMAPTRAFGGADYALAMCARLRGEAALARERVDNATALHRRMGGGPFVARSLLLSAELAEEAGDARRVTTDAREAAKLAVRHGMRTVGERAAALLASQGAAPVRGSRVRGAPRAIVFTDIESSTASAAALGDETWLHRLREHDVVVRKLVAGHGGREVKHLGDGFMLAFPSAASAVDFARELQQEFSGALLRVRAGIHVGSVVEEDGDIFGTTVNIAARVSAAASGGETLVSDAVKALVAELVTGEPRTAALKGVDVPMQLHPLA